MKLLYVVSSWKGGEVKVAFDLSREFIRLGHVVAIYTTNLLMENEDLYRKNINTFITFDVLISFIAKKMKLYITPQLVLALKNIRHFDIIHLHGYRTFQNIIIHFHCKKYGIPYVLQAHGSIPRIGKQGLKWIYDIVFGYKLLRDAAKVIALTRVEAEQYKSMGVPEEKIAIIPNGIDLSEYADLPPKGYFKKKFNIPEEKKIILYLGRIHRTKGIDLLIKAYAHLINKMKIKDTILVIVGPDDGYLKEVKKLTAALGVLKHVLFTGPLYGRDKLEAYVDSEFYVLPSRYETFPMTVLEAYACNKPVVASNVGGLNELVVNGETGLIFEAENHIELADKLIYMLKNPKETLKMGLNGRRIVEEKYSIEKIVDKLEDLYRQAC